MTTTGSSAGSIYGLGGGSPIALTAEEENFRVITFLLITILLVLVFGSAFVFDLAIVGVAAIGCAIFVFFAFPDARSTVGLGILGLGAVALLWIASQALLELLKVMVWGAEWLTQHMRRSQRGHVIRSTPSSRRAEFGAQAGKLDEATSWP
jgi:hypothetical protein